MRINYGYQRDYKTIGNLKMFTYILTLFAPWQKERNRNSNMEGHNLL